MCVNPITRLYREAQVGLGCVVEDRVGLLSRVIMRCRSLPLTPLDPLSQSCPELKLGCARGLTYVHWDIPYCL